MKAYRFILAALLLVLAACSQTPSPEVRTDEELTSQGILSGASGFVYYAAHNPNGANPYRVFRHDQATDARITVYTGTKEIQSVAGTLSGGTVFVSMRETSSSSSDFEIFKITSTTTVTQLTTNGSDDTNVSITRGGRFSSYKMAWEKLVVCGVGCFKRGIQVRTVSAFGGTTDSFISSNFYDFTQPSISGNGKHVAFIRKSGSTQWVGYYTLDTDGDIITKAILVGNGNGLIKPSFFSPSVSDDAKKIAYLSRGIIAFPDVNYSIKLYNSGVITNVVSGVPMSHPHLTADGKYITYAKQVSSAYRIVTRSLVSNLETDSTAPASPVNHYAPFWQKANP
jgi:hypothetical protein